MKRFLACVLLLAGAAAARGSYYWVTETSVMPIRVAGGQYVLDFKVTWNSFDNPTDSVGGKVELLNANGTIVLGRVDATVRAGVGALVSPTFGSVSGITNAVTQFCPTGNPAKGELDVTWTMPGLADGNYVLRFYSTTFYIGDHGGSAVWMETLFVNGSTSGPTGIPTIEWTSAPTIVGSGQDYTIAAHGHDDLGGLTQVNIWKETTPFVEGDGGDGTDGTSSGQSSDTGPATITYTAQAFTWDGTASPAITHTVFVKAPGTPPTVTLLEPAGQTVAAGTALTLSSRAMDPDGDLVAHAIEIQRPAGDWNFQGGFATGEPYRGGPVGSGSDSTRSASFTFSDVGTYQVRSSADDGSVAVYSSTVAITVVPANTAPTVVWTLAPGSVASGDTYTVAAHGHDDDGNLAQVNVWKNGVPFVFGGGGNGFDADAGGATSDGGPLTVTFTAQAVDAGGAVSATIAQTVAVAAPPVQYTLVATAGTGGSVAGGGPFPAGSTGWVTASPDAIHDFAGWSGDASGFANPLGVLMDRPKAVQANFSLKSYALTTSATVGGAVTPGGVYPYATVVTVAGTPDGAHRFLQWAGDAAGTDPVAALLMDRDRSVQAVFTDKVAQTIAFSPLADQPLGGPPLVLVAMASSGLPVGFAVVSGPASVSGGTLTIAGSGPVTVEATQPGDAVFLPAPPVSRTFNAVAGTGVKYRPAAKTILQRRDTGGTAPFVLETP